MSITQSETTQNTSVGFTSNNKPFFFRIEAGPLLDFATDPEGANVTLLRFAKDLLKGHSDIPFIQCVIDEAQGYIDKKREAGRLGGLARSSSARAAP
jgi:hypothetical protein